MNFFTEIISNQILITAIVGWFAAQIIKIIVDIFRYRKLDWRLLFATGGMPSSHSALVVSMTTATGLSQGFDAAVFAVATVFAFVVMYDAQGIRRQAGTHAYILNIIIKTIENPKINAEKALKELLGHTPFQVLGGAILGIIVALLMN
ncbi:divergent PAP2 family protein [Lactococcus petauri]|uniref:divergent PAP2 family protein n=1 Tax=Lactococcus petauri TaxID=1940789 RepID=UPI001BCED7EB|nr:divergent PAP2 family protein [Lactococcus petauri]MBS4458922.1 divergent PAP2 family protein [Lactococcus petauri]